MSQVGKVRAVVPDVLMSQEEWDRLAYPRGPGGAYVQPSRRLLGLGGQPKEPVQPTPVHKVHPYNMSTRHPPKLPVVIDTHPRGFWGGADSFCN